MKRYGQACAIARALDVIGERWSLLLVRELTLGPRRYRDLATGLPGIPSHLLAARLKDLQAAGVITRRTLPAPADVTVYELTDAGRALQPALHELLDWGLRYAPEPAEDDAAQPGWGLLGAAGRRPPWCQRLVWRFVWSWIVFRTWRFLPRLICCRGGASCLPLAPYVAGAGLLNAAASGSRARRAILVSPSTVLCRTASVTVVWPVRRL